jgi:hypothetical protein
MNNVTRHSEDIFSSTITFTYWGLYMNEVEKTGIKKARFRLVGTVALVLLVVILASLCMFLYIELQHYKSTHSHNDSEYDEALFSFYYVKQEKQRFGNRSLWFELNDYNWAEPYQENVFDCGEMSACLERCLENRGWHVKIVLGDSPTETGRKHAWLLVETSQGQYMPVESTEIELVEEYDRYFDNYFTYDYAFETIQDAIMHNESEFDWWKLDFSPLECTSIFDT